MLTFQQFCEEHDYRGHSGPRDFHYIRNNGKAKKNFNYGETFGQHIEPHGRYMQEKPDGYKHDPKGSLEHGTVHFKNPLVMPWGGGYLEPSNWKHVLHRQFKKKGRALSKAIIKKGHDGIITHDPHGNSSETVDLTAFK